MSAAATAAAALSMMSRGAAQQIARERTRDAAAIAELGYRAELVLRAELWSGYPRLMRPFWLAQRSKCPYCGHRLELGPGGRNRSSWDHVVPSSAGGRGHDARNKVIAHPKCNRTKGDRLPTACEVLFCQVTNEIVSAMREVRA